MTRNPQLIQLLGQDFPRDSREVMPIYLQLANRIRELIVDGVLSPTSRLPSSRVLAQDLDVSRMTVEMAFDQLVTEGFLDRRQGSGTFVADISIPQSVSPDGPGETLDFDTSFDLSDRGSTLVQYSPADDSQSVSPGFAPCLPDEDIFPITTWARTVARVFRLHGNRVQEASPSAGFPELRVAVRNHLMRSRGVRCESDQVVIVASTQQALDLLSRMLLQPGDRVWIEDPGYNGARVALLGSGGTVDPIPVDEDGLNVDQGHKRSPSPRLVYVTPSHQYPTGATLSAERRLQLLEYARINDSWIVEDDYDSEYRYEGRPVAPLQSADRSNRVIYIGTFNKVLFPGMRIAYMVLPRTLAEVVSRGLSSTAGSVSSLQQLALAAFMEEGHFSAHLRKSRDVYAIRRDIVINKVQKLLGEEVTIGPSSTGLHVCLWLNSNLDDSKISLEARKHDLYIPPLSECYAGPDKKPGLLLGFANVDSRAIPGEISLLARLFKGPV